MASLFAPGTEPTPEQAAIMDRMLVEVLSAFEDMVPDLRAAYLDPANDGAALERISEDLAAGAILQVESRIGTQLHASVLDMIRSGVTATDYQQAIDSVGRQQMVLNLERGLEDLRTRIAMTRDGIRPYLAQPKPDMAWLPWVIVGGIVALGIVVAMIVMGRK